MGLLTPRNFKNKKITGKSNSKITNSMVYPGLSSVTTSISGIPITYSSGNSALNNPLIFSAISKISNDVAASKFKTENTATLELLNDPTNGIISSLSFWQGVFIQMCMSGNAYVPILKAPLENIPPSEVTINYLSGNKRLQYVIATNNERPQMVLDQSQILHFRLMPDPAYRSIIGKSPLESLKNALLIDDKVTETQLNSMDNQMNPTGKLKIKDVLNADVDLQMAREEFEKANAGKNAGRLMVLPDGFDYEQFEVKSDVFSALNKNTAFTDDQIGKVFGVPTAMLGGGVSSEAQHSNPEQIKGLYMSGLVPYIGAFTSEIKNKLHAPDFKLDIKDLLDIDDSIQVHQISDLVKSGAISPNQAQVLMQRAGYLPIDLPDYEPIKFTKGGD